MTQTNDLSRALFVLGAADPEMQAIETLLTAAGVRFAHATVNGIRVHPGNAYKAEWLHRSFAPDGRGQDMVHLAEFGPHHEPNFDRIILVECGGTGKDDSALLAPGAHRVVERTIEVTRIDHHRPGDIGYGRGPDAFLPASSIGQVLQWLARVGSLLSHGHLTGETPRSISSVADGTPEVIAADPFQAGTFLTDPRAEAGWILLLGRPADGKTPFYMLHQQEVFTAAADHCLKAAYRGRCPGVDPDELMVWRAESRAAFQGRPVATVLADVEAARVVLRAAQTMVVGEVAADDDDDCQIPWQIVIADLRGRHVPELPEAACREGIPFLSTVKDRDGREKVVLQAAPADLIQRFQAGEIVPGLKNCYGDPARGFAGGYLS